jgi:hypothetical protein
MQWLLYEERVRNKFELKMRIVINIHALIHFLTVPTKSDATLLMKTSKRLKLATNFTKTRTMQGPNCHILKLP